MKLKYSAVMVLYTLGSFSHSLHGSENLKRTAGIIAGATIVASFLPYIWRLYQRGTLFRNKSAPVHIKDEVVQKLAAAIRHKRNDEFESLMKDIPVNAVDDNLRTVLHMVAGKHGTAKMARHLLRQGADVNAKNTHNETPLHLLVHTKSSYYNYEDEGIKLARVLLRQGADVNAKSRHNETPLHIAAGGVDDPRMASLLVEEGADVNAKNTHNETPLHIAAGRGNSDITRVLLDNRADVNAKGADGLSPLQLALDSDRGRHYTSMMVADLIKAGANTDIPNLSTEQKNLINNIRMSQNPKAVTAEVIRKTVPTLPTELANLIASIAYKEE
jgi:ankyrin repeat protein